MKYDADLSNGVEKSELGKIFKELHIFENDSLIDLYSDLVLKVRSFLVAFYCPAKR